MSPGRSPANESAPDDETARTWSRQLGRRWVDPVELRSVLEGATVPTRLREIAALRPADPAFIIAGETTAWAELAERVDRVAAGLRRLGAEPEVRVALAGETSLAYVTTYLALLRLGAVVALASPTLTTRELDHIVGIAGARLAVVDERARPAFEPLTGRDLALADLDTLAGSEAAPDRGPRPGPQADALLAFTSGTTGRPKAVPLTHANIAASIRGAMLAWRWQPGDVLIHALPLSHQHGLSGLHAGVLAGSRAVIQAGLDPEALLEQAHHHQATVLFGVPALYQRLLETVPDRPAPAVRLATCGSAALPDELAGRAAAWLGQPLLERYGTTESGLDLGQLYDGPREPGTVGLPLPGVEAALATPEGWAADGEDGEVCIRGPQVFRGYLDDPAATEQAFLAGGWFRTGDLGRRDPESGSYAIVGRLKELIVTGGLNVYPREVEDALAAHPAVLEVAVVGVPSQRWGEAVTALVVEAPEGGADDEALQNWARQRLAPYKRPKRILRVRALPRDHLGKLQRSRLQDVATSHTAGP